ncbi:MAG: DNA translocase FtsK [Hyphomicrobiaceae bacterium]|nr:MAG: DNA translocase FtsK [Hyphomicrobiaceae bacterium]
MAYQGIDHAPLLPSSLRDRLKGWLCKVLGFVALVVCAAGALSLLTWSAADPSLTHATSGTTRNLLGPIGAILSDLLMQMLGLASVFAFLPPVFWSLQLVSMQRLPAARTKLALAPIAVVFLAGALSSLPSGSSWPLHHSYGGILGDLSLELLASLLVPINPDRAWAAAGLFYLAAGLMVLMSSLGLSQQDLKLIWQRGPRLGFEGLIGLWHRVNDFTHARREPVLVMPPAFEPDRPVPAFAEEPAPEAVAPMTVVEPSAFEPDMPDSGRDRAFDQSTDRDSRTIAERFAPKVAEKPSAQADDRGQTPGFLSRMAAMGRGETAAYKRPALSMLKRPPSARAGAEVTQTALRAQARLLEGMLADFGVKGEVKNIHPGPVVTLFEFEPARGVKSARVIGLADDIARSMSAVSARVAVVQGRNAIGIELPNLRREKVFLRELLESEAFRSSDAILPLALGKSINGTPVFSDLVRMPHLLVAGTTGAGKSVGVNAMILSLLYRLPPEQCRFLMIDPKMLELSVYNGIPHLLAPVVTDAHKAVAALNWVVREMEDRYRRMSALSVRNIDVFNNRVRNAHKRADHAAHANGTVLEPMPYIVVVVDEFADLMVVAGKEIEAAVQRLAQMARAAGIHLIMATQRPSVDVITGTIKANFPTRISFKVASKIDSRTILNEQGAEQLLGQGDLLFSAGAGRTLRVHGPFVSDEEVEGIAAYLREQGEPRYIEGITDAPDAEESGYDRAPVGGNDLYERAVAIVRSDQKASTSYLQRRMMVGYNRAADLIERMEREGIVSPPGHNGRRQVLV